jgi:hypothetical protein
VPASWQATTATSLLGSLFRVYGNVADKEAPSRTEGGLVAALGTTGTIDRRHVERNE